MLPLFLLVMRRSLRRSSRRGGRFDLSSAISAIWSVLRRIHVERCEFEHANSVLEPTGVVTGLETSRQ
jgi:hypothetical protein